MMREDHDPETAASPAAYVRPHAPAARSISAPSPRSSEPVSVSSLLAELGDAASPLLEPLDWPALVALGAEPSPAAAEPAGTDEAWNPHLERWREKLRQRGLERWKEKLRAKRAQDEERQSWGRLERLVQRLSPVQRQPEPEPAGTGGELAELTELAELAELDVVDFPVQWQVAGEGRISPMTNGSTHDYAEIESNNEAETTKNELQKSGATAVSSPAIENSVKPTIEPEVTLSAASDAARASGADGTRGAAVTDGADGTRKVRTRRRRKRRLVRSESAPLAVAVDFWSDGGGVAPDEGVCLCPGCGDVSPTIARGAAWCQTSAPSLRLRCGEGGAPRLRLGPLGADVGLPKSRAAHGAPQPPQRGASHPNLWQRPKSPEAGERSFDKYRIKDPKQGFSAWAQRHLDLIEEAHNARREGATSLPRPATRRRDARQLRARARRSYPSAEPDSDEDPEPVGRTAPLSVRRSASVDSGTCTSPAASTAPLDSAARQAPLQPHSQRVARSQSVDSGRCDSPLSSGSAPVRRAPRRRPLRPRSVELPPGRTATAAAGTAAATGGRPRAPLAAGRNSWLLAGPGRGRLSAYFIRDTGVILGGGRAEPAAPAATRTGEQAATLAAHLSRALALVPGTHLDTHPDTRTDTHPDTQADTGPETHPVAAEDTDSDILGRRTSSNTSTLSSTNLRPDELSDFLHRVETSILSGQEPGSDSGSVPGSAPGSVLDSGSGSGSGSAPGSAAGSAPRKNSSFVSGSGSGSISAVGCEPSPAPESNPNSVSGPVDGPLSQGDPPPASCAVPFPSSDLTNGPVIGCDPEVVDGPVPQSDPISVGDPAEDLRSFCPSTQEEEEARTVATQTSPVSSGASSWSDLSERTAADGADSGADRRDRPGAVPPATREATTSMSRRPAMRLLRARSEEPSQPAGPATATSWQWQSAEQMHRLDEQAEPAAAFPARRPSRPLQLQLGESARPRQRALGRRPPSPAVSPLSTPGDERPAMEDKPPRHAAGRQHQRRRSSHLYLERAARMSCSEPTLDKPGTRPQMALQADFSKFQGGSNTTRSYSAKQLAEWEALEACRWLRDAGFPQYAQMYEECRCPIDLRSVQSDHPSLDLDSRHALFKRINTVNRATNMKLEGVVRRVGEESDDDEARAISDNWSYLRHSQRWRRHQAVPPAPAAASPPSASSNSTLNSDSSVGGPAPERRSGRERLQDGILRRMESLRARRKRAQKPPRDDSSSYFSASDASASPRAARPGRDDSGALSDGEHSPPLFRALATPGKPAKDANSNVCDGSDVVDFLQTSSPKLSRHRGGSLRVGQSHGAGWRSSSLNMGKESQGYRRKLQGKLKRKESSERPLPPQCPPPQTPDRHRVSTYDNSPIVVYNRTYVDDDLPATPPSPGGRDTRANSSPQIQTVEPRDRSGSCDTSVSQSSDNSLPSTVGSDQEQKPRSTNVVRWHSFHRSGSGLLTTRPAPAPICPTHISRLSSGQIALLKKHALLRITATMERHCPSKSSNWNWDIPKFMRKFRVPDYRDRRVFGVPLSVTARRSGHPLPPSIIQAMDYLRKNALDQVGLFRKSGVRSRIQKVREMCEAASGDEPLSFDDHQAYDVADMIKQYFRELPEVLLTHKISEILIAIYQYVPSGLRQEATKCALLLMPDESRLALQTLLAFLSDVAAASYVNQMTAHNLAVCLAPSVFSVTSQRSASASPRRTRRAGVPDQRELNENRAAHECLAALIRQSEALFCLPEDLLSGCRFSYLDVSQPVALPALGTEEQPGSWRAYTDACCAALMREARDRPRGWVAVAADDPGLDLAYRKVGDGHQLRLWRAGVEVEAPPAEVLHRLLRQRHAYDLRLVKWRVVDRLAADAEVFQYAVSAVEPLPVTEYCVLRAWRSDLPRGACAVVETSVEHPDSPVQRGGRRGVVLASRYLVEPCGAGKSRVTHFSRADHRGCSPEWYNKVYGHLIGLQLTSLRESFRHTAEGPESQV